MSPVWRHHGSDHEEEGNQHLGHCSWIKGWGRPPAPGLGAEQKLNYCPEGMVHTMNNLIFNAHTPARPPPIFGCNNSKEPSIGTMKVETIREHIVVARSHLVWALIKN